MQSKLWSGVIAGIVAGLVFGVMMQVMMAPTPDGGQVPMMAMVAKVVGSDSMVFGWLYHLFNSAIIGGVFGWLCSRRVHGYSSSLLWGAGYGLFWWALGGLILMPIMLGMPAFAPVMMEPMRPVAMGSLFGHILFGLILGGVFVLLNHRAAPVQPA